MASEDGLGEVELFKELSISVEGREVLRKQTMAVKPGTITVLMGPSGVGKSILSDVVFRLRGRGVGVSVSGSVGDA